MITDVFRKQPGTQPVHVGQRFCARRDLGMGLICQYIIKLISTKALFVYWLSLKPKVDLFRVIDLFVILSRSSTDISVVQLMHENNDLCLHNAWDTFWVISLKRKGRHADMNPCHHCSLQNKRWTKDRNQQKWAWYGKFLPSCSEYPAKFLENLHLEYTEVQ